MPIILIMLNNFPPNQLNYGAGHIAPLLAHGTASRVYPSLVGNSATLQCTVMWC